MDAPLLLVSNDDGVTSKGITALATALAALGRVVVCAPETEQSATSHSITLSRPLRLREVENDCWAVDGTPVDCVYIALHHRVILPRKPDLVVSGINHGANMGSDVFYSGTVAAAREGAMRGIPSIAISMVRGVAPAHAAALATQLARALLEQTRGRSYKSAPLLNVNVPVGPFRGAVATRLGPRLYDDLVEERADPRGRKYLWIGGPSVTHPPSEGTDTAAFEEGLVSITPLTMELCADEQLPLAASLAPALHTPT